MSQGSTHGVPISTDSTFAANSDGLVPSQKAVKAFVSSSASGFGARVSRLADTVYQALTDGLLQVEVDTGALSSAIYTILADGSNPPVTLRCTMESGVASNPNENACVPIRQGEFYKIVTGTTAGTNITLTANFVPVSASGAGGGTGDLSSNTSTSVDGETVVFSGVTGKLVKRVVGLVKTSGAGNPQGVQSAPVGAEYLDTTSGYRYIKLGGGSTAYGWYRQSTSGAGIRAGMRTWQAYPGGPATSNPFAQASSFGYFSLDASAVFTGSGISASRVLSAGRQFAVTTNTAATTGNVTAISSVTSVPLLVLDDDFDLTAEILTGPDVTNLRVWFGISSATIIDTTTLGSASNGSICIRFCPADGDAGWIGATQKNGAGNQTLTSSLGTVALSTIYLLRVRFVRAGTPTAYFSVNDGTEQSITTNIQAIGSTFNFVFGLSTRANALKSIGYSVIGMTVGS